MRLIPISKSQISVCLQRYINVAGKPKAKNGNDVYIVLNFDLNKTILAQDPYDNILTAEVAMAELIATRSWGQVVFKNSDDKPQDFAARTPEDYKQASWELKHEFLTADCPEAGLVSYRQFLNKAFEHEPAKNDAENDELTRSLMKERNEMLLSFPTKEGKLFKSNYDKLLKNMKLPSNCVIKGDISDHLRERYESKRYYTIPAFFRTLLHLRKRKRDFSIVFRTHGRELPKIIEEFNLFCDGNHPAFNGEAGTHLVTFNGTKKNTKDYRIKQKQTGLYFRFGKELSDVSLIMNTLERMP